MPWYIWTVGPQALEQLFRQHNKQQSKQQSRFPLFHLSFLSSSHSFDLDFLRSVPCNHISRPPNSNYHFHTIHIFQHGSRWIQLSITLSSTHSTFDTSKNTPSRHFFRHFIYYCYFLSQHPSKPNIYPYHHSPWVAEDTTEARRHHRLRFFPPKQQLKKHFFRSQAYKIIATINLTTPTSPQSITQWAEAATTVPNCKDAAVTTELRIITTIRPSEQRSKWHSSGAPPEKSNNNNHY